ncbi:MAG: hypothetical protein SOZ59_15330 [Candidatus Limivivens sp.]|nr:hypothetical protein [Candidatus Limivivens sp.]
MDNMFVLIDLLVAGFGVYILYGWYLMAKKGEVKENLVLPKDTNMKRCKDREGYIACIQPKLLVFGIATTVCGAIGVINDFTGLMGNLYLVVTVIFLIFVIWFGIAVRNAAKKYF